MSTTYDFQLLNAATSKTGTMLCSTCHHDITEGDFLSYRKSSKGDWAFVTHHRECSMVNPKWAAMWAKRECEDEWKNKRSRALLAEAKEFREKWGVEALDDLIEDLSGVLACAASSHMAQ